MNLISRLVRLLGRAIGGRYARDIGRLQSLYQAMSTDQLKQELQALYATPVVERRRFRRNERDPVAEALAIAACLFDRFPCDLSEGSTLYEEQRDAALYLACGLVVQMDTGEGKTYAIAVAALALLAEHSQVVVITPNSYLARRDHRRVKRLFDAVGVRCSAGPPRDGGRGVYYMTIGDLCFLYLRHAYGQFGVPQEHYPRDAAVIVDEIDSVLIDQARTHTQVRSVDGDDSPWAEIFEVVRTWGDEEAEYDPVLDVVSVNADGWEAIAHLSTTSGRPVSLLMGLATAALWALRAVEGRNYRIDGTSILLINSITGETYASGDVRSGALEYLHFQSTSSVSLAVAEIEPITLLKRHPLVVGTSGTAQEEAFFFLQNLRALTAPVPARFERHPCRITTGNTRSRAETYDVVAKRIADVQPRPVIVGTWSPEEVSALGTFLLDGGHVRPTELATITAFDSDRAAGALDRAGELGRVTVMSQGGSRGVDVRSDHRPYLIVLGRAVEPRLDRQFLGRVGRHGEPFDAEFILDPSSPVKLVGTTAEILSFASDGTPIDSPMVERAVRNFQRQAFNARFQSRQRSSRLSDAVGTIEVELAARFELCRGITDVGRAHEVVDKIVDDVVAGRSVRSRSNQELTIESGAAEADFNRSEVGAAIKRRAASDAVVDEFEEAAVRFFESRSIELTGPFRARTCPGNSKEIRALTSWVDESTRLDDAPADQRALRDRQTMLAVSQKLPSETSPRVRPVGGVAWETLVMANASYLEQKSARLDALRVSSPRDVYYRRATLAIRSLHAVWRLGRDRALLTNLRRVDEPDELDDLFFVADHLSPRRMPRSTTAAEPGPESSSAPGNEVSIEPERHGGLSDEQIERLIESFIADLSPEDIQPPNARVLLLRIARPILSRSGARSAAGLRDQVQLALDDLAAAGVNRAAMRVDEKYIYRFLEFAFEEGHLPVRLVRESRMRTVTRRARRFAATIPPIGALTLAVFSLVVAIAMFVVVEPVRMLAGTEVAVEVFGFGSILPDRPLLLLMTVFVVIYMVLRAFVPNYPFLAMAMAGAPVSIAIVLLTYVDGFASVPFVALLALGAVVWVGAYFQSQRIAAAMLGSDIGIVVVAASILVVGVASALDDQEWLMFSILLTSAASFMVGPSIPIVVGSSARSTGRAIYTTLGTKVRMPVDPGLTSALAAYVVTVFALGVVGSSSLVLFGVVQILMIAYVARRRLSPDRVKQRFARLEVGCPLTDHELISALRRRILASVAFGAVVVTVLVSLAYVGGVRSVTTLLLLEWSGVLFASGIRSLAQVFTANPPALPAVDDAGDEVGLSAQIKARVRQWRRLRFARVIQAMLLILVFLRLFADWTDLVDAAESVWDSIVGIFT